MKASSFYLPAGAEKKKDPPSYSRREGRRGEGQGFGKTGKKEKG